MAFGQPVALKSEYGSGFNIVVSSEKLTEQERQAVASILADGLAISKNKVTVSHILLGM